MKIFHKIKIFLLNKLQFFSPIKLKNTAFFNKIQTNKIFSLFHFALF